MNYEKGNMKSKLLNHPIKATFRASSDVALVKYWGKKDERLRLPENGSISMVLDDLYTTTTVEFSPQYKNDEITIDEEREEDEYRRVSEHLDRIRKLAGVKLRAKVVSENSFPKSTGLSSSGSGFAALTLAASKSLGMNLERKQLSILARKASGSACRCVCGGFVEWIGGNSDQTSFSRTIFPARHWDLRDVVVVVNEEKKRVSSTAGHKSAESSPFFKIRKERIDEKIKMVKRAIKNKEFSELGELVEAEALEFHSILLTSNFSYIAWHPGTVEVMLKVEEMRSKGVEAYFTINTGFNVHLITLPKYEEKVIKGLENLALVKKFIRTKVGEEPKELREHLF